MNKIMQKKAKEIAEVSKFIEIFSAKNNLKYQSYVDTEIDVQKMLNKIEKAVKAQFSNINIITHIESEDHRPPFSPSWEFKLVNAKNKT